MPKLSSHRISNPDVAAVFKSYPKEIRPKIKLLRQLIIEVANTIEAVGPLEEALKWGEPSYLTSKSESGSTIRIDWKEATPDQYAIYFKCTTDLVVTFKRKYPKVFVYGGERSIIFNLEEKIPEQELKMCIALALTYHLNKKMPTKKRWNLAAG